MRFCCVLVCVILGLVLVLFRLDVFFRVLNR